MRWTDVCHLPNRHYVFSSRTIGNDMSITQAQKAAADQQQSIAATDSALQVRLIAGPGTGKSGTIIKRVVYLLGLGVNPRNLYVISFTRVTCADLSARVSGACANSPLQQASQGVRISTMHSLALKILRRANLLAQYPSDPALLDKWEQANIYDLELSSTVPCTPTRAGQIRLAHDSHWQTLNPAMTNQGQVTPAEVASFNAFHSTRTNLYSCVLPGEVVFKCVEAFRMGSIQPAQLPSIDHLIVDEFQDLNACDQEFVRLVSSNGAALFIAGDDDQSIYSFRHADPTGIVQFQIVYPQSRSHPLTDCFRCTPAVLTPATRLIQYNPNRLKKNLLALYGAATPPVTGTLQVWSFLNSQAESQAIAASCQELIRAGMAGREDEILILISNRKLQLDLIALELGNLGLPFEPPRGETLAEDEGIRAVYALLRICEEQSTGDQDYIAYRTLLHLLGGIGVQTARGIADGCVINNQNFRLLFNLQVLPHWITGRALSAVQRVMAAATLARTWRMTDTLGQRINDINLALSTHILAPGYMATVGSFWTALAAGLPQQMTMQELYLFLSTDNESDQQLILDQVNARIGINPGQPQPDQKKIRILTMHGAKGLSGKVVFIPSCEQGIMPSDRAIQAVGLLIEQRRLLYVSITRAMAACILTHAGMHAGAQAFFLRQQPVVRLTRSQFLNEMASPSVNRNAGLTQAEARAIVTDIGNL
jgi:DNA helicase-2/ATP-dependent DNA helicase PcrA